MRSNNIKSFSDLNSHIDSINQKISIQKEMYEKTSNDIESKLSSEINEIKKDFEDNIKAIWDSLSLACENNFLGLNINHNFKNKNSDVTKK